MTKPQPLFTPEERAVALAVRRLSICNPFLPERIATEREILGAVFVETGSDWNRKGPPVDLNHNVHGIIERADLLAQQALRRWPRQGAVDRTDQGAYIQLVLFTEYHRFARRFDALIEASERQQGEGGRLGLYQEFRDAMEPRLTRVEDALRQESPMPHLFACCFQVRRAFHHLFHTLVGVSAPLARLRGEIWRSIFTQDLDLYRRRLFQRMGDFSTLITGPSGTGKELVARAIARSRYLEFDPKTLRFKGEFHTELYPLHLSALPATLIESELFGHRRGAFTGALEDRKGWMETCPATGTVFLDEIGEVSAEIQVKLLRVLQVREFHRMGETESRRFRGKVIAATNRDLAREIAEGRFREDFYYRLCSDQVRTPSLREQLDNAPEDLPRWVAYLLRGFVGDESEALAREMVAWMEGRLGSDYPWPGNFRELEQCVRSWLVRKDYTPSATATSGSQDWNALLEPGRRTAAEVLARYVSHVVARSESIEAAARSLDLDRRTVLAKQREAASLP